MRTTDILTMAHGNDLVGKETGVLSFYYARDYGEQEELIVSEIADRVCAFPDSTHHVWRDGMEDWAEARTIPEISECLPASTAPVEIVDSGNPYRYTIDGTYQRPMLAAEIAKSVQAHPTAVHRVWQDDFMWWPFAQEVPEIAQYGPLPPIVGDDGSNLHYLVLQEGQQLGRMSPAEVAERVQSAPNDSFLVWRIGMTHWESPRQIQEILEMGLDSDSTEGEWLWMGTVGGQTRRELTSKELVEWILANPDPAITVWRIGFEQWVSPWDVDELVALGIGEYPGRVEALTWMYCLGTKREKDLSPAEIAQRVALNPDASHLVWQLGMERWVDPYDLPDLVESLPTRTVTKLQRQLMHSRDGKHSAFRSPQEIVAQMEQYPQARHKVWPQLAERWYDPWDVEELIALGVTEPEYPDDYLWHFRLGSQHYKDQTADQIALAVMKNPDEESVVWQGGWLAWRNPRDVPAIAALLPRKIV